jgi:replication factor C subunit 1
MDVLKSKSKLVSDPPKQSPSNMTKMSPDVVTSASTTIKRDASAIKKPAEPVKKGSPAKASSSAPSGSPAKEASEEKKSPAKKKFNSFAAKKEPAQKGMKELPVGVPGCLTGKNFVISGVLNYLEREAAADLIKEYGGSVKTAVSGKTNFLLLGSVLEDDREPTEGSKYKKMVEVNAKKKAKDTPCEQIDEDRLFDMISKTQVTPAAEPAAPAAPAAASKIAPNPYAKKPVVNPYAKKPAVNPYAKTNSAPKKAVQNPYLGFQNRGNSGGSSASSCAGSSVGSSVGSSNGSFNSATKADPKNNNMLWADKYKPKGLNDLVGNAGQVKKLQTWLQYWEGRHVTKRTPMPKYDRFENPGAKAVLISGPPGIGKTSAAALIGKQLGFEVQEMNASDQRSKKLLEESLGAVLGTQVLSFGKKVRRCIH